MALEIKAFGLLAEIIGSTATIDSCADTDSLRKRLSEAYPSLGSINYAIAIDRKVVSVNTNINDSSTIALLPAFSGG